MLRQNLIRIALLTLLAVSPLRIEASSFIHTDRHSPAKLEKPSEQDSFTFAVFGDRTSGRPSGLRELKQAVAEMNVLGPDLVMTVGDLIQGYNQQAEWLAQMEEFKTVMKRLHMPWFPVPGNHDMYWRGDDRPEHEHEGDFEAHFGPLWYAFEHKDCWFIVLLSDEGNPETGEKNFKKPECQKMSPRQTAFLVETLQRAKDAQHVFVFLHHPRWNGGQYGDDWERIHQLLARAGNVSACFAGHTHTLKFNGTRDGIEYYTLATTGGNVPNGTINPLVGALHHYDLVTVRGDEFHVATVPLGTIIDPQAERLTRILLPQQKWVIHDEQSRTLRYPIRIPPFTGIGAVLDIGIAHAVDDNGDKGITYELTSAEGQVIRRGFLCSPDYEWLEVPTAGDRDLLLLLEDKDTSFASDAPGNDGQIQIELEIIKH